MKRAEATVIDSENGRSRCVWSSRSIISRSLADAGFTHRFDWLNPNIAHCRRMLNTEWLGSTYCRFHPQEGGSLFFHPLRLHLQPTDLLEQFDGLSRRVLHGCWLDGAGEDHMTPAAARAGFEGSVAGAIAATRISDSTASKWELRMTIPQNR